MTAGRLAYRVPTNRWLVDDDAIQTEKTTFFFHHAHHLDIPEQRAIRAETDQEHGAGVWQAASVRFDDDREGQVGFDGSFA